MTQMSALIAAMIGIALSIAAHLGSLRVGAVLLTAYAASFAVGAAATIGVSVILGRIDGQPLSSAITALVLYGAWWFIFLNLVQGLESSLRVHILREIQAAGGSLPRETLLARYNDEHLMRRRLDRLRSSGVILDRDGQLFVTSAGLRFLARFFRLLKVAILGRHSEFE